MFMYTRVCASSMRELARRNISSNSDVMQARAALSYMCSEPRCNIYIYMLYTYIYVYQVRTHAQKYFIKLARSRKQSQSSGLPISSDAMSNPDREDMVHVFMFYKICVLCLHNVFFAYKICVLYLQNICSVPTNYVFYVSSAAMSNCLRFFINMHISMQHIYMGSIHNSIDM